MKSAVNNEALRNLSVDINMDNATVFEWDITSDSIVYFEGSQEASRKAHSLEKHILLSPIVHHDDVPVIMNVKSKIEQGALYATADFRLQTGANQYNWYRIYSITQYDNKNRPAKAVGILFNVDKEIFLMKKLQFKAERDALTGLYNRKETEDHIRQYLMNDPEEWCALFIIDTDNFKSINDTKGHMFGDVVLTEMAEGMQKIIRDNDVIGRIGGDEFSIFMKKVASKEAALKKAENLVEMFNHLFINEKAEVQITCSIGISLYPEDGRDFKSLYVHADQALYQAKKQGKNRYIRYNKNFAFAPGDHEATTLGTTIDSGTAESEIQSSFLADIFRILYRSDDIDFAINMVLKMTGKRFDVSRAYIFENRDDSRFCSNTYEWCSDGVLPQIQNLQDIDYNTLNNYDKLFDENCIFYCRDITQLNAEQLELFESQGVNATLQVSFKRDEKFAGFVGFDECTGMRLWTQEEIDTLSLISQIVSTFLQKKRAQEQSEVIKQQIKTILDTQDSCIYVIDQNTFELLYLSSNILKLRPDAHMGEWCYKSLFGRDLPCEFCPIKHGGNGEFVYPQKNCVVPMHASSMKWLGNDAYLLSFNYDQESLYPNPDKNTLHLPDEQSIVDCIHLLTSSEYLEDSIEYVLNIIQNYYQSERVYIIEIDEEGTTASNTYEICAEGITPQIDMLQQVSLSVVSFWMDHFEEDGYIKIDSVDTLAGDRQEEREILEAQGIDSLMAIPLYINKEMKGFLGIDDPKRHKKNFHYLRGLSYFLETEMSKNALYKNLEKMSYSDALTGLENRNSYMKYCDEFSMRMPKNIGVIFMDINGLKQLNTSKGHVYGDMMVAHIAEIMKRYFPNERKFRLSGDEFLIISEQLLYPTFIDQLKAMKASLFENGQSLVALGRTWSDLYTELPILVSKAEKLMRINKNDYYKQSDEVSAEKLPLLQGLVKSIANKEYLVYLQPQLNVASNQVDCAEVLVRYRESDGSILAPVKFIPMLETEGLISNVDFFVMEESCKLLEKWNKSGRRMRLALNFSRITLFEDNFFEQFWNIFNQYDITTDQLEIEITETQELLNKKQLTSLLEELKSHGFKIALDDFGVGYSSYEFLMMFDFDTVKIDKGVTQRVHECRQGEVLMKHIAQMGNDLKIKSCAEGIETKEQLDFVKEIGCDYAQGYLIDKPVPAEQFEKEYINK